jgi:hypothetical protein
MNASKITTELAWSILDHGSAFEPGLKQHPGYVASYAAARGEVPPACGDLCAARELRPHLIRPAVRSYALNDEPHPQVEVTFGFPNLKPDP